jgi:hypothetical protein
MKISIFNSLPQHHEMFAHVLDYFNDKKIHIDVYTNKTNHYGWLSYYEKEYRIVIWYPISFFNVDAYDYVFLLTDDDTGYKPFWKKTSARVIVIEHYGPRQLNLPAFFTVQTRQFMKRNPPSDSESWILPVWNNTIHEKYKTLTVMSIGNATNRLNLQTLFSNYSEINFILCDRDLNTHSDHKNVTKHNKLDASKLIEFAAKSHYILFWPTTDYARNHQWNSISGCFPLAYSVGTPILLPESFVKPIGLSGLVGISDGGNVDLNIPTYAQQNDCMIQRTELLKRRNNIYNSLFYNNTDTTILLTSTVYVQKKEALYQVDPQERINIYIKSIRQWLYDTELKIVLVENSGYEFKELDEELKKYSGRFEIILFNEDTLEECEYLRGNADKGASELFSINYAYKNSRLLNNTEFIIKITGRYFIKELESYIQEYNLKMYDVLCQNNYELSPRCEMIGCNVKNFNVIFDLKMKKNPPVSFRCIEFEYRDRIFTYNNILICKKFKIEPTQRGGLNELYLYI